MTCQCQHHQSKLSGFSKAAISKTATDALVSGTLAVAGWWVASKYFPKYEAVGAIVGTTAGTVITELFDNKE